MFGAMTVDSTTGEFCVAIDKHTTLRSLSLSDLQSALDQVENLVRLADECDCPSRGSEVDP